MGTWLLAIESLILSLLWMATGMAWKARHPSFWRSFCLVIMFLLPLVMYGALGTAYLIINSHTQLDPRLPFVLSFLLAGYLIGLVVLWIRARRPLREESATPTPAIEDPSVQQASHWPLGKLALATLVALMLHTLTFWNLDSAMQQRLEALRVEAAAKALGAAPGKPADRENAAILYEQAFKLFPKYQELPHEFNDWMNSKYFLEHPDELEDPKLIQFLESQAPAMKLIQAATKLPACSFERNYAEPRIDMLIPEVSDMRQAGRLFLLQARVDAAKGNLADAIAEIQPIYIMGEHVAADPLLISMLVSFALDGTANETLQAVLSGQQPTIEELAPLDFGPPEASSRRLSRALRMEEAFGLATFGQMASDADMWPLFNAMLAEGPNNGGQIWALAITLSLYRVLLLPDDVQEYRQLLGEFQQLAPLTPAEAEKSFEDLQQKLAFQRRGIISNLLVPAIQASVLAANRHAAKMEVTRTGIAVHRYRAEHGQLPKSLADLVPKYLDAVPLDPYTDKPLQWKTTGDDWVVYSVGEDLKDDGGAVFNSLDYKGDIGFYAVLPAPKEKPSPKEEQLEQPQPEQPEEEFKIPSEPAPEVEDFPPYDGQEQ